MIAMFFFFFLEAEWGIETSHDIISCDIIQYQVMHLPYQREAKGILLYGTIDDIVRNIQIVHLVCFSSRVHALLECRAQ
jgi:hypothetical protein